MDLSSHIPHIISYGGQQLLMICGRSACGKTGAVILLEEPALDIDGDVEHGIIPVRPPHAVSVHVDIVAVSEIK